MTGKLTPREAEVMFLLMEDRSYAQIARKLGVGYKAIHFHKQNICAKLGVSSREELVALMEKTVITALRVLGEVLES